MNILTIQLKIKMKKKRLILFLSYFPHIFYKEIQKNKESFLYNDLLNIDKDNILNNISIISTILIYNLCQIYYFLCC